MLTTVVAADERNAGQLQWPRVVQLFCHYSVAYVFHIAWTGAGGGPTRGAAIIRARYLSAE